MNRRTFLSLTGTTLGASAVIGTARAVSADFDYPATGTITSTYYDDRDYGNHQAVDIANNIGTPIHAARAGTASTHYAESCGNYVVLNHGNGYETLYCHMSDFDVTDGESVSRGEVIGNIGTSGNVTGPHVHFEVNRYGDEVYIPGNDGEHVSAGENVPKNYPGIGGGGGGGGDGGSGGDTVIRLKGHTNTSYSFHTTGDINRYSTAETHDENITISGNDHDEIQGWVGGGNWDKFNFAGALAWIDTPNLYVDIDDDVIRFEGNAGSGKNTYSFHTTGDIDKLASGDGNDKNQYIKGNDHDEIQGVVYAGHKDAFRFDDRLAWIDTPDLYIDIDYL
jgi:murein DD-endopeptidase MepM/ murein hydrolase activator NlpD